MMMGRKPKARSLSEGMVETVESNDAERHRRKAHDPFGGKRQGIFSTGHFLQICTSILPSSILWAMAETTTSIYIRARIHPQERREHSGYAAAPEEPEHLRQ